MDIFFTLLVVLFILTCIYYVVYFSLAYYWHETKLTFLVLPIISTFEFFLIGFLVISIISIIVNYIPEFLSVFSPQWL